MKKKAREELKGLPSAEMAVRLRQTQERLWKLKFQKQTTPSKNPLEIRDLRKQVARLKTWLQEKNQ